MDILFTGVVLAVLTSCVQTILIVQLLSSTVNLHFGRCKAPRLSGDVNIPKPWLLDGELMVKVSSLFSRCGTASSCRLWIDHLAVETAPLMSISG